MVEREADRLALAEPDHTVHGEEGAQLLELHLLFHAADRAERHHLLAVERAAVFPEDVAGAVRLHLLVGDRLHLVDIGGDGALRAFLQELLDRLDVDVRHLGEAAEVLRLEQVTLEPVLGIAEVERGRVGEQAPRAHPVEHQAVGALAELKLELALVVLEPVAADPLGPGDGALEDAGAENAGVVDRVAALGLVVALDEVIGDLLGHQPGAFLGRVHDGAGLGRGVGGDLCLAGELLRAGIVASLVRLLGQALGLGVGRLHLRRELRDRGGLDRPVPVVGREEHVVELGLAGDDLGTGLVHEGRGALRAGQLPFLGRGVAALVLREVLDPAQLDDIALGHPVVGLLLEAADDHLDHFLDVPGFAGAARAHAGGAVHGALTAAGVDSLSIGTF